MDALNHSVMNLSIAGAAATDAGTISIPIFDGSADQWRGWKQDITDYLQLAKYNEHVESAKTGETDTRVKLHILRNKAIISKSKVLI